jgi:hypothetical protein
MIVKIMIRIGSLSLFENVEIRNQRYTSVILSFRNQICIMIFMISTELFHTYGHILLEYTIFPDLPHPKTTLGYSSFMAFK